MQTKTKTRTLTNTHLLIAVIIAFFSSAIAFGFLPNFKLQPIKADIKKVQNAKTPPVVCNKQSDYATMLRCYPSLGDLRQHLRSQSVQIGNAPMILEDAFVVQLLRTYSGDMTNEQKLDFIAQNITPLGLISEKEKQYIFRVVHMLWYEKHGTSSWSIKNYTPNDINTLVWVKGLLPNDQLAVPNLETNTYFDDRDPFEPLSFPAFVKLSSLAKTFLSDTHEQTTVNAIRWYKQNFFHAYTDGADSYGWERYNDNIPGQVTFSNGGYAPMSLERLFEERISGCHDASTVLANMLRSLNIPALDLFGRSNHMRVYLPTLNKFIHGDHVVEHAAGVPAENLLLTPEQLLPLDLPPDQYSDYDSYIRGLFASPEQQFILGALELKRNGDTLFIQSGQWCAPLSESTQAILQQELPEFHLHPSSNDVCYHIIGDALPIQTIDQLEHP